jgi:3-hydroxybutyryl-CoA dehydrogenase
MKVGIIGTGTMGKGIAQVFAEREGFEVFFCGRTTRSAEKAVQIIKTGLDKRVTKGKISAEEVSKAMERIHPGEWLAANACDLIIESVPEDYNIKVDVLKNVIVNADHARVVTNTSSLSLFELQKAVDYPLIGMHFFNPAPVMKLVEVVHTERNTETSIEKIKNIAEQIGKTPIVVKDNPGIIVNRLLITMINEAVIQYEAGVASAQDIDTAMKLGANYPMGPLELADYIGIDVVLAIMKSIQEQTGSNKYKPADMLINMVEAGRLGRKSGEGFYKY